MKRIVLLLVILAVTANAWGDRCRIYDYQEMKDMTDLELQYEIDTTQKKYLSEMEYANNMSALKGLDAEIRANKLRASADQCEEQLNRLQAIKTKRHPVDPKNRPTLEDCRDMMKKMNQPDNCEQLIKERDK